MATPQFVSPCDGGCVVEAFVQPRAARSAVVGVHGRALKLKVSAPALEGRANRAAEELLAGVLGVPPASVRVVSGQRSRHKRIEVAGADPIQVSLALGAVLSSRAHERR